MQWIVEVLNDTVRLEIKALPVDMQAKFLRISDLVVGFGIHALKEPYVKHIQGKIWEMRLKGKDGIARALYVTVTGRRVVILRAFIKKTQKTPREEIELALRRMKELDL
ncbi:MAG: type II toxin-antitoxin system RelE/ParE family toxin [Rickettsiales bacterium]|jgi:phage-related protein|nr:type II toxin-antitoxin system RelE/ParE family toxin [Rickettsiales bacterium]